MRKSSAFFLYTVSLILLLVLVLFQAHLGDHLADLAALQARMDLVKRLGLTDLCLFTEARYTRHPSQADFHAPFQDGPLSLEYFPSGSLMPPPPALKKPHAPLD